VKSINTRGGGASSGNGASVNIINLNSGVIRGEAYYEEKDFVSLNDHGNGGGFNVEKNNGIISGSSVVQIESSLGTAFIFYTGNGSRRVKLNNGILTGYSIVIGNSRKELQGGVGSYVDIYMDDFITTNLGAIKGSQSAIGVEYSPWNPHDVEINNYGIMAGREIFSSGAEEVKNGNSFGSDIILQMYEVNKENNQGTYINLEEDSSDRLRVALDKDGDVIVEEIIVASNLNTASLGGINNSGKTILNAKVSDINVIEKPSDEKYTGTTVTSGKDSYEEVNLNTDYANHIINGAGIKNAVLSVKEEVNVNLSDSIVNGYKTAMSLDNNSTVVASNTIFNGGGLKNEDAVISVKGNNGNLTINGTSIINGKTDVLGSNSTVNIGNGVMVNGDLTSKNNSNNTLNLGDKTSEELRLFHNIDGFTTINTSGNVTAYETAKISSGDIHVKDGKFVVRVDGTERDGEDKVIGHALYDHVGKISIEVPTASTPSTYVQELPKDAQLVFKASGLGVGTIIAMKDTDITNLYDPQLGTMSIAHTAIKHKDKNGLLTGDVEIAYKNFDEIFGGHGDLPTPELDSTPEEPSNPDNSNSGDKGNL
ncbi:MAG: hypothetical protein ACRDDH_00620, partial [Cetobacterium sp.]|uniref:hypothetical protein n=1 Tax=Cetobacterium sp. TaxID=2071632 RepID=UPI003EE56BF9